MSSTYEDKILPMGSTGEVKLVKNRAYKRINKNNFRWIQELYLSNIISCNNIPNVSIIDRFEFINNCVIFDMPRYGDDLFYLYKCLSYDEIDIILRDILIALANLHDKQIVHRDLKIENICYDRDIKKATLIDFSHASKLAEGQLLKGISCFHSYRAPEIYFDKEYSYSIDIWGLGIILYIIASKSELYEMKVFYKENIMYKFLFSNKGKNDVRNIMKSYFRGPKKYWNIISMMLEPNSDKRPNALNILKYLGHEYKISNSASVNRCISDQKASLSPLGVIVHKYLIKIDLNTNKPIISELDLNMLSIAIEMLLANKIIHIENSTDAAYSLYLIISSIRSGAFDMFEYRDLILTFRKIGQFEDLMVNMVNSGILDYLN